MQDIVNGVDTHGDLRAGVLADLNLGFSVLTDGATVTWDTLFRKIPQAKLTSTQSFTINMTNILSGAIGTFKLITSTGSAITMTFDTDFTNKKLGFYGEETFTTHVFPAATAKEYILTFVVEGTTIHWQINDLTWTAWTPTFGGFSAAPTVVAKYLIIGKSFHFFITPTAAGTSNATAAGSHTFDLPSGIVANDAILISAPRIVNNGANGTNIGMAVTAAASGTVIVYREASLSTLWTGSGSCSFGLSGTIPIP